MSWLDSMLVFSPSQNTVTEGGQMPFARGYGGAAVINRSIYIIGGGDGNTWLNSAARYDIDTHEWFQVRPCLCFFYYPCCSCFWVACPLAQPLPGHQWGM
jgi:hypothetical protein